MEDLSAALARNFSLTSKEDTDVDVGGGVDGVRVQKATFDVVGRVVSEKTYYVHTLKQNI